MVPRLICYLYLFMNVNVKAPRMMWVARKSSRNGEGEGEERTRQISPIWYVCEHGLEVCT